MTTASKLKEKTTRVEVAGWCAERIKNAQGEVSAPDITREAQGQFSKDRKFIGRFFAEHFHTMVYEIVIREIASTRSSLLPTSNGGITREALKEEAQKNPVWEKWLEHAGEGRHIPLMEMTGADLDLAIEERWQAAAPHLAVRSLLLGLRQRVGDEDLVSDHWTIEEIEQLRVSLQLPEFN